MVNDEKVLALEKFEFAALVQQLVVVEILFELVAEYIERVVDVSTVDMLSDVEFVIIVEKIVVAMVEFVVEIVVVVEIAVDDDQQLVILIVVDVVVKLFLVIADDEECFVGNKQLVEEHLQD